MLDPLTSLGIASNVVQLVQFGSSIAQNAHELSKRGTTKERARLKKLAAETKAICNELDQQLGPTPEQRRQDEANVQQLFPSHDDDRPTPTTLASERGPPADLSSEAVRALSRDTASAAVELEELLEHIDKHLQIADDDEIEEASQKIAKRQRLSAGRTRRVAATLLRGLKNDPKVEEAKSKMQYLQSSMILRLAAAQSISQTALLKSLHPVSEELMRERESRLAACNKTLSRYQHYPVCTDEERACFASKMEDCAEQLRTASEVRRILKTLVFHEVYSREDAIPEAHANTFSWIFDKETTSFGGWASNKSGVFWITGKPGCGKSTLMKYIVQHSRTLELLRQWAGDDELVIAHHYFWNAGTSMQRSQVGLLRTLLYHIILQSADLALECLPQRFIERSLEGVIPWTHKELCEAIRKIGLRKRQGVRLCFFIDGLDEYEGEPLDLISLISTISESPCIKVCVSSRPWNAFTSAYHKRVDGEIEVQHLTGNDIRLYVTNKINDDQLFSAIRDRDEASCALLVQSIIDKAQGVFLWVYLVVRSLLRGLTNGDDLKILRRRLISYPDTLDGYFQRMFNRIEVVYHMESSRLMITALAAEKALPFWAPRCIELETENPDYATAISVPPSIDDAALVYGCDCARSKENFSFASDARTAGSSISWLENANDVHHSCYYWLGDSQGCKSYARFTADQTRKLKTYLDARCADLLEVHPDGVGFIHRTAKDFLAQSDLSLRLYALAGSDYDVAPSLARLAVVNAKRASRLKFFNLQSIQWKDILRFQGDIREPNRAAYNSLADHLKDICTNILQTDPAESLESEHMSEEYLEEYAVQRQTWDMSHGENEIVEHLKDIGRKQSPIATADNPEAKTASLMERIDHFIEEI